SPGETAKSAKRESRQGESKDRKQPDQGAKPRSGTKERNQGAEPRSGKFRVTSASGSPKKPAPRQPLND
ncbi:MAG: hypothetical protein HC845_09935, partial [Akkermansiaceae bacterium]|nr:hypothetical protein [Akkermansiaceae bacterium]